MTSQRKFFISELIWLDKNEPFYRDAYVSQHFVPLTAEFNASPGQTFSCTTIRNRLQSYRSWKGKKRTVLRKGPKRVYLTTPEKVIKKSNRPRYLRTLSSELLDSDTVKKRLSSELLDSDMETDLSSPSINSDSEEERSIRSLFPDVCNQFNMNHIKQSNKSYQKRNI